MSLLKAMPQGGVCAEIGVWKAAFSRKILAIAKPSTLHLVDPWAFAPYYPRRMYGGTYAKGQPDMNRIADAVARSFADDDRVIIHRMTSKEFFAKNIPLDWIYIDGDHTETAVLEDLWDAWKIVKPGGIIAGDDYYWVDADGSLSVKRAVDEFSHQIGIQTRFFGGQYFIEKA